MYSGPKYLGEVGNVYILGPAGRGRILRCSFHNLEGIEGNLNGLRLRRRDEDGAEQGEHERAGESRPNPGGTPVPRGWTAAREIVDGSGRCHFTFPWSFLGGKETCQGLPGRSYTRPLMDSDDRWACVSGEMNGERGGVSSARPRERELTWLQCGRGRREWRQLWQRVSSC